MSIKDISLQQLVDSVQEIAREAGKIIRQAIKDSENTAVHHKGLIDLVTDTDRKVEQHIIKQLTTKYKDSTVLAEEDSSASNKEILTNEPTWIIDPIDGTTNYVHQFPNYCVSIALAFDQQIVLGVVYHPVLDEMCWATKGGGAFLNGNKIKIATTADTLSKAVVATNVGYDRTPEGVDWMLSNLKGLLLNNVQSIRCCGSAAWDMVSVGIGRLDVFYEKGIHAWDIAAASIIVKEAGGVVVDLSGAPLNLMNRRVLCGNATIVDVVRLVLSENTKL
eukprot:TRINITY_DN1422_c0_g1_i1.p1 TRINITY_DN1422_c0_g1~~TRINITY_DN1422_c0_g1_i1.p1  ORF type:complete len:277 (-),score=86.71 TRINITY_DN1422_c0_g1_i1:64-894(-)